MANENQNLRKLGLAWVVVAILVSYVTAGVGIGYLAWAKLGAPWWVLLIFSMAGLTLAFYRIYQVSKREL